MAAERALGTYATTQALLHLIHALWIEASSTLLVPHDDKARLIEIKEDVLLRALRHVHVEVWIKHAGWKYAQLRKLVSNLYDPFVNYMMCQQYDALADYLMR